MQCRRWWELVALKAACRRVVQQQQQQPHLTFTVSPLFTTPPPPLLPQDALYQDHVLEGVQDAIMHALGPITSMQYARWVF